jgi:uncharacterized protein (TIGR00369 family)
MAARERRQHAAGLDDDSRTGAGAMTKTAGGKTDLSDIVAGFQSMVGYRLVRWERDLAEVELDVAADGAHHNRSGFVHGGVHATLLDTAAGIAGVFCPVPENIVRAVTLSFAIQYIAAAKAGTLRAIGRRRGGGRSIFFAAAEILDSDGKLIATGEGTYRYMPGFEPPTGGPREKS